MSQTNEFYRRCRTCKYIASNNRGSGHPNICWYCGEDRPLATYREHPPTPCNPECDDVFGNGWAPQDILWPIFHNAEKDEHGDPIVILDDFNMRCRTCKYLAKPVDSTTCMLNTTKMYCVRADKTISMGAVNLEGSVVNGFIRYNPKCVAEHYDHWYEPIDILKPIIGENYTQCNNCDKIKQCTRG